MTAWVAIAAVRPGMRTSVLQGRFIERPHRFAARVELAGGEIVEAHVPNPGRLTGVLAPGCRVIVEGPLPPPRTLRYTMLAARAGRTWIGTVTTYANRVFPALLAAGLFPELGSGTTEPAASRTSGPGGPAGSMDAADAKPVGLGGGRTGLAPGNAGAGVGADSAESAGGLGAAGAGAPGAAGFITVAGGDRIALRREVVHGRSRFDFQVGGRFVEVKSVSLAAGPAGLFPDAVTVRGARHCDELAALARRRHPAAIVFVAQRGDVESVAPEDAIDADFGRALRGASRAGVLVLACALDMTPRGARAARRVPVLL